MLWNNRVTGWKHWKVWGKFKFTKLWWMNGLWEGEGSPRFKLRKCVALWWHLNHSLLFSDWWQSFGFCEFQRLGRSRLHSGGFCLQNAGWDEFLRGCWLLPQLCCRLHDAVWGCQPERRHVSVGALSRRRCRKSTLSSGSTLEQTDSQTQTIRV